MKFLNEKTITERFIEKHDINPDDTDACDAVDAMRDYYDFQIIDMPSRDADLYAYEESTADGYSVYVVAADLNSICVSEEIYHSQYGIADVVVDALRDGLTVSIDEYEDIYREAIDLLYVEFIEDATEEIRSELIEKGYVKEISDPLSVLGFLDMLHQKLVQTESNEYIFSVPEKTTETTSKDLRAVSYYEQIMVDRSPFCKYVRKVLNCQMVFTANNSIELIQIPESNEKI